MADTNPNKLPAQSTLKSVPEGVGSLTNPDSERKIYKPSRQVPTSNTLAKQGNIEAQTIKDTKTKLAEKGIKEAAKLGIAEATGGASKVAEALPVVNKLYDKALNKASEFIASKFKKPVEEVKKKIIWWLIWTLGPILLIIILLVGVIIPAVQVFSCTTFKTSPIGISCSGFDTCASNYSATSQVCLSKQIAGKSDDDLIDMYRASHNNGVVQAKVKVGVIKEIIDVGAKAGVSNDTIAFVLSISPTESAGSIWTAKNPLPCYGIGQICAGQAGGNSYENWTQGALGRIPSGDEFLSSPELQMKTIEFGLKGKISGGKNNPKLQGQPDIFIGAAGWLGVPSSCNNDLSNGPSPCGDGSVSVKDYATAALNNYNIVTCNGASTQINLVLKEPTSNTAVVNNYFSPLNTYAQSSNADTGLGCLNNGSGNQNTPSLVFPDGNTMIQKMDIFFQEWGGKSVPRPEGYDDLAGQCVSAVRYFFDQIGSPVPRGNAYEIYANAPGDSFPPDKWAKIDSNDAKNGGGYRPGDIVFWRPGQSGGDPTFGHIAIVYTASDSNGDFLVLESNWATPLKLTNTRKTNISNTAGILRLIKAN